MSSRVLRGYLINITWMTKRDNYSNNEQHIEDSGISSLNHKCLKLESKGTIFVDRWNAF